jgi:hypothetical protein
VSGRAHGFAFQRLAPDPGGPLFARRDTIERRDEVYLGGFTDSCHATRTRKSSLIVAGHHWSSPGMEPMVMPARLLMIG